MSKEKHSTEELDVKREDIDLYDKELLDLKDSVKVIKKIKRRKKKIKELQNEKNQLLKKIEKKHL